MVVLRFQVRRSGRNAPQAEDDDAVGNDSASGGDGSDSDSEMFQREEEKESEEEESEEEEDDAPCQVGGVLFVTMHFSFLCLRPPSQVGIRAYLIVRYC